MLNSVGKDDYIMFSCQILFTMHAVFQFLDIWYGNGRHIEYLTQANAELALKVRPSDLSMPTLADNICSTGISPVSSISRVQACSKLLSASSSSDSSQAGNKLMLYTPSISQPLF